MTFLSPSIFWLLGALSVPIIIHVLNRFKVKEVNYSSISLINELRSNSIYRLNLRKILILILRLLFIASLVLMFARPVTKGFIPGWLAAEQESSLVIIIDNSASMTALSNGKIRTSPATRHISLIDSRWKSKMKFSLWTNKK